LTLSSVGLGALVPQQQPDAAALVKGALGAWAPLASQVQFGALTTRQEAGGTVASGSATVFGVQAQVAATMQGTSVRTLRLSFPQTARVTPDRLRSVIGEVASLLPSGLAATASLDYLEMDFQGTSITAARAVMGAGTWAPVSDDLLKLSQVQTTFTIKNPTGARQVEGAVEGRLDLPASLMQLLGIAGTQMVVRGALSPQPGAMTLSAAIATGVKLDGGGKITIQNARIELSTKPSRPGLALAGKMSIDAGGTPLVFQADVAIDVRGRMFAEGWMDGMWDNPFGISRDLHVHDLGVGFGINFAAPVPMPTLAFQGGLKIGNASAPAIQGALTLGLDPANPTNSMIDAQLGNLTLLDIVKAFSGGQPPAGVSGILGTIGVQNARLRVVPPGAGVDLFGQHHAPGFLAQGTLSFVGVGGEVLISIDETGVEALAAVSRIQYPGFSLTAANDANLGPYIYVVSRPSRGEGAFVINGALEVLGIRSLTDIYISDAGFSATLNGKLANAFQATLEIAGDNIFTGGSIWVKAELQNDFFSRANSVGSAHIQQAINDARREANQQLTAAQGAVNNAQLVVPPSLSCEAKNSQLNSLYQQRSAKQRQKNQTGNALANTATNLANLVANGTSSAANAVGSFFSSGLDPKAAEAEFNRKRTDLERNKRDLTRSVNQLGNEIASLDEEIAKVGSAVCGAAQDVGRVATTAVNTGTRAVATAGLELAKGVSSGTLQAAAFMEQNANPMNLFNITRASGTACLSMYATSQMTLSMELIFAGQPVSTSVTIDLANPDPGIRSLAGQLLAGGAGYGGGAVCTKPEVARPAALAQVSERIARLSSAGNKTKLQAQIETRPEWAKTASRAAAPITTVARELERSGGVMTPAAVAAVSQAGAGAASPAPVLGAGAVVPAAAAAPVAVEVAAPPTLTPGQPGDGRCAAVIGPWMLEPDYRTHQLTFEPSGKWYASNGGLGEWQCADVGGLITVTGLGAPLQWAIPPQGGMLVSRPASARPVALPAAVYSAASPALFGGSRALAESRGCCKPGRISLSPHGMQSLYLAEDLDFAIGTSPVVFQPVYNEKDVRESSLYIRPALFTVEGVPLGVTIQSARNPNYLLGYVGQDAVMLPINPYWRVFRRVVSWVPRPALAGGRGVSFESVGQPGYYLHASGYGRDQRLKLAALDSTRDFRRAASFDLAIDASATPPPVWEPPRLLPGSTTQLGTQMQGFVGAAVGAAWISQCDRRPESVAGVRVYASEIIHAVGLFCRDMDLNVVPADFEGRSIGTLHRFMLEKDERIIAVSGAYDGVRGPLFVTALQFHTSRRSSPVYGNLAAGQIPFRFDVPAGFSFNGVASNFVEGHMRAFAMNYAFNADTPTEGRQSATYRMEQALARAGVPGMVEEVKRMRAQPATKSMSLDFSFRRIWLDARTDTVKKRAIAEAWVQDMPESWYPRVVLAEHLFATDRAAAVTHAEKAVALAPYHLVATLTLLQAYAADRAKSIPRLEAALAAKPNDAWTLTALAALETPPTATGTARLEQAIKADTAQWMANAYLAMRQLNTSKTDEAMRNFRRALVLNPWAENYVIQSGYDAIQRRDVPLAIRLFELVVEVRPSAWNGYDSLGEALAQAGQKQRAIAAYETSMSLNPLSTSGKEALAKLKAP